MSGNVSQRYMTTAQAAEFMGVSVGTIRAWKNSGRLVAYYLTAKPSFLVTDLIDIGENAPNFPPAERD
jgi:predicted site-specific integrase-resolvase